MQCFICKESLLLSASIAKCPYYYVVLYMQRVIIILSASIAKCPYYYVVLYMQSGGGRARLRDLYLVVGPVARAPGTVWPPAGAAAVRYGINSISPLAGPLHHALVVVFFKPVGEDSWSEQRCRGYQPVQTARKIAI